MVGKASLAFNRREAQTSSHLLKVAFLEVIGYVSQSLMCDFPIQWCAHFLSGVRGEFLRLPLTVANICTALNGVTNLNLTWLFRKFIACR